MKMFLGKNFWCKICDFLIKNLMLVRNDADFLGVMGGKFLQKFEGI